MPISEGSKKGTKLVIFSVPVLVFWLAACGPASLPSTVEVARQASPTSVDQSTNQLSEEVERSRVGLTTTTRIEETTVISPGAPEIVPTATLIETIVPSPTALSSSQTAGEEGAENESMLSWNLDPNRLIVSATFCCGRVTNVVWLNYIPDALIWGDGRIIWVQQTDNSERRLLEGQLTVEQVQALLQRVTNAGFFDWQDNYIDRSIADAAEQCLSVEVDQQSKKVCEYVAGAPQAFHDLYAYIAGGAGINGVGYIPSVGYLTAHPLKLPDGFTPPVDQQWPTTSLDLSLEKAVNGVWVEGEVLEQAWSIVNAKWKGSIIQDGQVYYHISVQVPGLSQMEPPPR